MAHAAMLYPTLSHAKQGITGSYGRGATFGGVFGAVMTHEQEVCSREIGGGREGYVGAECECDCEWGCGCCYECGYAEYGEAGVSKLPGHGPSATAHASHRVTNRQPFAHLRCWALIEV